jgi:hypothetical protein
MGGDVLVRQPDGEWAIPQRSDNLLASMLKKLDSQGEWHLPTKGWSANGNDLIASAGGVASFPRTQSSVKDRYGDGYPGKLGPLVERHRKSIAVHDVGDLRLQTNVRPAADCRAIEFEFREGQRRYRFSIPGPASAQPGPATLTVQMGIGHDAPEPVHSEKTLQLKAGSETTLQVQNIDDRLRLMIDGEAWIEASVDPITQVEMNLSGLSLSTIEGGAEFNDVEVWRDIYYTSDQSYNQWNIPRGHYVMLGDNTQDSSDSRDWKLGRYEVTRADGSQYRIQGNLRGNENPRIDPGPEAGAQVYFTDELGERHEFALKKAEKLTAVQASFVPRELIRGRAVLVVWPMVPSLDVYRFRWVR